MIAWQPKASDEVKRYVWTPALAYGDSISSYTATPTTVAVDSDEQDGDDIVLYVSGTASGTIALEAVTANGETITDTAYVPVGVNTDPFGYTARDVCDFALRKVTGLGEEASGESLADAMERLNDMVASWASQGADIGVPLPIASTDTLRIEPFVAQALKNNLILQLSDQYNREVSQIVAMNARMGLQQIKTANLNSYRSGPDYF